MTTDAAPTDWLRQQNLTPADLLSPFKRLSSNETIVLTGSVATGYANALSDIDLLLLGWDKWKPPRAALSMYGESFVFRLPSGHEINVNAYSDHFLTRLATRVSRCARVFDDPDKSANWTFLKPDELRVLWQVYVGKPLHNYELAERYRSALGVVELPEHVALTHVMNHYTARKGAITELRDGQARTALLMLRSAYHCLAEAALASLGDLSNRKDWILRRFARHAGTLSEEQTAEYVRGICLWPEDNVREHVLRATQFGDTQITEIFRRMPRVAQVCKVLSHQHRIVHSAAGQNP
jgi:Nucleotidyltransferase domain